MANGLESFIGTELKLNLNIAPIDGMTMDEYEFEADVYCSKKNVLSIPKSAMIRVDESNYIMKVDTALLGAGEVKCIVRAEIPDADFEDLMRTEVVGLNTEIQIVKTI